MKLSNEHSLLIGQYQEKSKKLIQSFFSNQVWKNKLFLATVIAPTAVSILYFGVIATTQVNGCLYSKEYEIN